MATLLYIALLIVGYLTNDPRSYFTSTFGHFSAKLR